MARTACQLAWLRSSSVQSPRMRAGRGKGTPRPGYLCLTFQARILVVCPVLSATHLSQGRISPDKRETVHRRNRSDRPGPSSASSKDAGLITASGGWPLGRTFDGVIVERVVDDDIAARTLAVPEVDRHIVGREALATDRCNRRDAPVDEIDDIGHAEQR